MLMPRRSSFGLFGALLLFVGTAGTQRFTEPARSRFRENRRKRDHGQLRAFHAGQQKLRSDWCRAGQGSCPGANVATGLTTEAPLQIGKLRASQRHLEHLGCSRRKGMDAHRQQAKRAASPRLRFRARFWPHHNECENARRRGRDLADRGFFERRE